MAPDRKKKYYVFSTQESDSLCRGFPSVGYTFTIGKLGEISDVNHTLELRNKKIPEGCLEKVTEFVSEEIRKDSWQPGKLYGKVVRTNNHVRVYLGTKKD